MGYHLVQLLLFIGRFFLCVNTWTCRFAAWLTSSKSVGVDVSHAIFNVECRVSGIPFIVRSFDIDVSHLVSPTHDRVGYSIREYGPVSARI